MKDQGRKEKRYPYGRYVEGPHFLSKVKSYFCLPEMVYNRMKMRISGTTRGRVSPYEYLFYFFSNPLSHFGVGGKLTGPRSA